MSDAQYRLLIQRSFDEELSKQEHRALIDHLEASESGAKFHHQLDQMIQAAQDTPLPDELRPQNPEALARMIMEQLPQKKGSVFGFLGSLFGGGKPKQQSEPKNNGKAPAKAKSDKVKAKGKGKDKDFDADRDEMEESGASAARGPGIKFPRKAKEVDQEQIESQVGGISRLKSIGTKAQELENREAQSTTRSLGEKFSMPWAANQDMGEGPLTLAEHIKRKVTESQKLSPLDEDDLSGSPMDNTGGGGAFSSPAAFARQQIEQNPMPMGGGAEEEKGWSAPAPSPGAGFGQAPAFGQAPSFNQAPAFNDENRGSAIGLAPKQAEPQAKAPAGGTEWGGGWGGGSSSNNNLPAQPAPAANEPAAKSDWGAGWSQPTEGRTPLKSSESWAMPGSEGAGGWNQAPAKQESAPQPVAEPAAKSNDPWGAPAQAPVNEPATAPAPAWGGDAQSAAPAPAWGGDAPAAAPAAAPAPAWGNEAATAPAPAPAPAWGNEAAPAPAPAPAPAWGNEAAPTPAPAPAWGNEAAAAPAPAPAWGNEAAAAPAPAPAWGNEAAAAPAPAPAPAWGNEAAATPAPAPAWGNEAATAPAPAPAWGNEAAAAPAPAWGNEAAAAPAPAPAWGNEAAAASAPAPAWGNEAATKPAPAPAPSPAWGNEAAAAPAAQAPAAQGGDAWGQAANWNAPAAPAAQAPAAADPWAQPPAAVATQAPTAPGQAQGGWGAQPAQAAPDANKPAQAGSKRSWATAEPDLIETGTFRAFTPTMDNQLGAKTRPEPPRPAASPFANTQVGGAPIGGGAPQGGGGGGDNRWDLPIQERLKQASQMDGQIGVVQQPQQMPAPQAQAPAQAAPADNRWDLPIQERIKMQQDGQQMVGTAAPVTPVGMPGTPGSGIPVNQIVEKMGEVLQGGQPNAAAQSADNRWDVPIQERNKQSQSQEQQQQQPAWGQAQAPAQAPVSGWGNPEPAQAPAPAQAPVSGWGNPEPAQAQAPAQAPVSGWGNPEPAQAQAPVSGWGNPEPAPAPVQAQSGWGNPEPVQAQPAPQINQGWPQSQNQGASGWNQAAQAPAQAPSQISSGEITDKGKGGGLFNIDDKGIDQIFDGIGVSESMGQSVVNTGGDVPQQAAPAAPVPQQASPWATAQPAQQAQVPAQSFAPPAQPAAPAPQAAAPNSNKGLFQLDDSEVDQIFNNIGVNEPSVPVVKTNDMAVPQQAAAGTSGWAQAPAPQMVESQAPAAPSGWGQTPQAAPGGWGMQPAAAAPAPDAQAPAGWPSAAPPINPGWSAPAQAPAEAQQPGAFAVDDKVMNSIFAGAPGANQAPVQPVISAITPAPKIEGIGRLDASADNSNDQGSGRIAAIGKFLLDQKDLDKIGKLTSSDLAEGKLRILTTEASQDLQELLGQIGKQAGVLGSVIVGHDGLLIANTMPQDMDAESVGVWALGVYMNTEHVTKKMGHDRVHQVVSRTPKGYVVIADFGGGLLVTLTEGNDTDQLIPLMRTITLLVN